jgi:Tfp pilus assembly protein PilO
MAHRLSFPSRLQWQLLIRRADPWLLAALIACLASASLQWGALPAIEREARTLHGRLPENALQNPASAKTSLVDERFRAFRERLTDDGEQTEALKKIFAEAIKSGITLQQGEYALVADVEGDFARLQITLPVKGSYPQIRTYAQALLQAIPALSLDEIGFRRDSVRNPHVEARLRFTLYLKGWNEP